MAEWMEQMEIRKLVIAGKYNPFKHKWTFSQCVRVAWMKDDLGTFKNPTINLLMCRCVGVLK